MVAAPALVLSWRGWVTVTSSAALIQSTSIIGRVGQLVIDLEEVGVDPPYVIPSVHGMRASKLR